MFYGQLNKMKKHQTFGMGTSYNYKNMLWGKLGYYLDNTHKLTYPTFGLDFKYDKYNYRYELYLWRQNVTVE